MKLPGPVSVVGYLASIVGANVAFTALGIMPVGFGFVAPVAVFVVGFTFIFRDFVQDEYGKRGALMAMAAGLAVSFMLTPGVAAASLVAFAVSELADFAVYTALRRFGFVAALVGSNAAGIVVDSVIFLGLAFGAFTFLPGQIIGKCYATIASVLSRRVVLLARETGVRVRPAVRQPQAIETPEDAPAG